MNLIEQSATRIIDPSITKRIEICARVCYQSEGKICKGSDKELIKKIIQRGHESVLEHGAVKVKGLPFTDYVFPVGDGTAITNLRALRDNYRRTGSFKVYSYLKKVDKIFVEGLQIPDSKIRRTRYDDGMGIVQTCPEEFITFRLITNRAIANELVRHRVMSFSQESTRYCKYDNLTFIKPSCFGAMATRLILGFELAEFNYAKAVKEQGLEAQIARDLLPLGLKTEIIMSGTKWQWNEVFKLRCDCAAHPQIRELMFLVKEQLKVKEIKEIKEVRETKEN